MFDHTPHQAQQSTPSTLAMASFDVQWGKPVFRAPDLSTRVKVSADISFAPLRTTEIRKAK